MAFMHVIVWQFDVDRAHREAFERTYGAAGDWARLFARAAGYLGTQLLADCDVGDRYLTLDRWRSEADFAAFRATFADEYARLDAICEGWTSREERLGVIATD